MAIHNLFQEKVEPTQEKGERGSRIEPFTPPVEEKERSSLFSAVAARLFFLLLLVVDALWSLWSFGSAVLFGLLQLASFGRVPLFRRRLEMALKSFRRSLVCGVSLFLALFSPSFGIMVACTYFVSRDKEGIDECVPASLQEQFREFLVQE